MAESRYRHLAPRVEQGILVLTVLEPELRTEDVVSLLQKELFDAVAEHAPTKVVIDLHEVKYLGSAGFHPLLNLRRQLQEQGSRMILCGLSPVLAEVFRITRLIHTASPENAPFQSANDVAAAIEQLGKSTPT
jgi:anti-anti-sigma factor